MFSELLNFFKGREVNMGTSMDAAPLGSVGKWLQQNVTRTAIASYVGPILLSEGYAVRGSTVSKIRFNVPEVPDGKKRSVADPDG